MVLINSGGSAGSGSGASPTSPKKPKEADTANGGKRTEPAPALPPRPSPSLTKLKVAARKVKKDKDKGEFQWSRQQIHAFTLMGLDLTARKGLMAVLAAKDGLPFIEDSQPEKQEKSALTEEQKQLRLDDFYWQKAEETGKPVTAPDGAVYRVNPRSIEKDRRDTKQALNQLEQVTKNKTA